LEEIALSLLRRKGVHQSIGQFPNRLLIIFTGKPQFGGGEEKKQFFLGIVIGEGGCHGRTEGTLGAGGDVELASEKLSLEVWLLSYVHYGPHFRKKATAAAGACDGDLFWGDLHGLLP
jgi:hypothetical protein